MRSLLVCTLAASLAVAGILPWRPAPLHADQAAPLARAGQGSPASRDVAYIQELVDRISLDSLRADVLALQEMGTRYAPSRGNLRAATWARDAFRAAGLADASLDEFTYFDEDAQAFRTTRNVVATRPGELTPARVVIVGAHFDTATHRSDDGRVSAEDADAPAPGADDNGTGVAAVLAAARLLAPRRSDCTIRFVLFSAEEAGIFGSARAARQAAAAHEDVVAMIDLDMLGYVKQTPEDLDVLANRKSAWLLDRVTRAASRYAPGLLVRRVVDDTYDGSDHGPFWHAGYPAVCFMDDYYPSSPFYHTPRDTADRLDGPFFLGATRLAVGVLAELAGMRVEKEAAVGASAIAPAAADWQEAAGRRLLVALSPATDSVQVIDVSVPTVTADSRVTLGPAPADTWSHPQDYPVGLCRHPGGQLVYVPSVRLRPAPGDDGRGTVTIVDSAGPKVIGSFRVGANPGIGAFDAEGRRYYQPYWETAVVDVFDTASLARVATIPVPSALSRLVAAPGGRRAVGIPASGDGLIVIDLGGGRREAAIGGVPSPSDVAIVSDDLALVASRPEGALLEVDLEAGRVRGRHDIGARPHRVVASPDGTLAACLHRSGTRVEVFAVDREGARALVRARTVIDLGETIVDGAFADADTLYLVSSSHARLAGVTLSSGKVFWAMRTGGVRAKPDVKGIAALP